MLHIVRLTLIGLLSISLPTAGRKVIVKNSCKGTIWPAYASTRNRDPLAVITGEQPGWKLDEGGTSELTISDACEWISIVSTRRLLTMNGRFRERRSHLGKDWRLLRRRGQVSDRAVWRS